MIKTYRPSPCRLSPGIIQVAKHATAILNHQMFLLPIAKVSLTVSHFFYTLRGLDHMGRKSHHFHHSGCIHSSASTTQFKFFFFFVCFCFQIATLFHLTSCQASRNWTTAVCLCFFCFCFFSLHLFKSQSSIGFKSLPFIWFFPKKNPELSV